LWPNPGKAQTVPGWTAERNLGDIRLECVDMDAEKLEGRKSAVVDALKDLAA
jgi:hypothetical protein